MVTKNIIRSSTTSNVEFYSVLCRKHSGMLTAMARAPGRNWKGKTLLRLFGSDGRHEGAMTLTSEAIIVQQRRAASTVVVKRVEGEGVGG